MYQEWFKKYEKLKSKDKKKAKYCPVCGRKMRRNSSGRNKSRRVY